MVYSQGRIMFTWDITSPLAPQMRRLCAVVPDKAQGTGGGSYGLAPYCLRQSCAFERCQVSENGMLLYSEQEGICVLPNTWKAAFLGRRE